MKSARRFLTRLFNSATRRGQEERLREEIEEHIALRTEDNLRAGLSPVEARRQTMMKFGGVEATAVDCYLRIRERRRAVRYFVDSKVITTFPRACPCSR